MEAGGKALRNVTLRRANERNDNGKVTAGLESEDAGEEAGILGPDRVTESGTVDFPALASCRRAGQDREMGSLVSLGNRGSLGPTAVGL